jgi:hypothetical protein
MLAPLRTAISSFQEIACGEYPLAGFVDVIIFIEDQVRFGWTTLIITCMIIFFQDIGKDFQEM